MVRVHSFPLCSLFTLSLCHIGLEMSVWVKRNLHFPLLWGPWGLQALFELTLSLHLETEKRSWYLHGFWTTCLSWQKWSLLKPKSRLHLVKEDLRLIICLETASIEEGVGVWRHRDTSIRGKKVKGEDTFRYHKGDCWERAEIWQVEDMTAMRDTWKANGAWAWLPIGIDILAISSVCSMAIETDLNPWITCVCCCINKMKMFRTLCKMQLKFVYICRVIRVCSPDTTITQ